jgi:predicted DCC family thiol-disulfide oxidoreductase YuxK
MSASGAGGPVLFFDGECGLCNRVVRLLLAFDRRGTLRFGPLQGPAAQAYLRVHHLPAKDFSSLVFAPDGPGEAAKPLQRTDGVIAALRATDHPGWAAMLAVVPRPLRDAGYKIVARMRYSVFGPWRPRPLPRPEWAARFLE